MAKIANDEGFSGLGEILKIKKPAKKPPAHQWQDLALRVIDELKIPAFKRGSVFKICRDYSRAAVEQSLNDTKELCKTGEAWKYFFKIMNK